ncbi:hypothetical protein C4568_01670 [Candidatus Parcubacteria bacterium]|nr:MAG: hypothetical protein C4568_01670 [Candidatus Parcubacteria bacterium]
MSGIRIVEGTISVPELRSLAHEFYGDIIKAAVDVRQGVMGVGGEFHSEIERVLTEERGSRREDTWGINLLLDKTGDDFIEFDSMINLKPAFGNKTRNVEDANMQAKIREIVAKTVLS